VQSLIDFQANYLDIALVSTIEYSLWLMNSYPHKPLAMLINELAKRTGLSVHTIRFYERYGFVKGTRNQSSRNNYFHYDEEAVQRLELVVDAKSVGFTLQEIAEIIDAWYGNVYTKTQKLRILADKIVVLDTRIKELRDMKRQIQQCMTEL